MEQPETTSGKAGRGFAAAPGSAIDTIKSRLKEMIDDYEADQKRYWRVGNTPTSTMNLHEIGERRGKTLALYRVIEMVNAVSPNAEVSASAREKK